MAAVNQKTGRRLVGARSGGVCELRVHGLCEGRATDWQHRRNRSQGGTWAPSNGIHSCRGWTVLSWEDWRSKQVRLYFGFTYIDDEGGYTPPEELTTEASCR